LNDYLAQVERLRKEAASSAMIRDLATDEVKSELFDRLATHLTQVADEVEKAMNERENETLPVARPA